MEEISMIPCHKSVFIPFLLCFLLIFLGGCTVPVTIETGPSSAPTAETTLPTEEPTVGTTVPEPPTTEETTLPEPEPLTVVSTATITATGDLLMHIPVINSGLQTGGTYNFDNIFQYLSGYASAADYAVINLETTLCGTGNGYPYSGYPKFNCPDAIIDGAAAAGFDMILTANNHCNDTGTTGFDRTLQVIEEKGLASLGTKATEEETDYRVVELNGISVGMVCYTYSISLDSGAPNVNGLPLTGGTADRINLFNYEQLDAFYSDISLQIEGMRRDGAEAIVLFIHWGEEYQLSANHWQRTIAQSLCDLGVDVIIGNHPHVVQSLELLTATDDETRKTVCLYSTGNAVSNQRKGSIDSLKTAHTEDGVLFSVTFARFSDGTVALDRIDALPFWVYRQGSGGSRKYIILPLDGETAENWKELYSLSDSVLSSARSSYDRTMTQLGDGLGICQVWLTEARAQHEADHLASQTG